MAAKLLHSLTDDNVDLQKQIGCMTGIFQMFDRQHILTGTRRITGPSPRRPPSGNSNFNGATVDRDSNHTSLRSASLQEKYSNKHVNDRQKASTESSRASFSSSSRSSSFSSLDCNRATQLEPASFDRIIFPETPSKDPAMSLQNSSPRQTLDLRDLVKDSMYREVQGLSVRAKTIEEATDSRLQPKIINGSTGFGPDNKQRTPADLKESLRVLAKLQEAPWYNSEPRELLRSSSCHAKDGSSFSISRDAPRFSYDGREANRAPFDSRDFSKSTLKIKDLPRLSLDSREGSSRKLNAETKSNIFSRTTQKDIGEFDGKIQNLHEQAQANQARPPSVVAKLMGLETLPNSVLSSGVNMPSSRSSSDKDILDSSAKTDPSKQIQLSSSSKSLWKEPSSPRWRNPDSSMKPLSRFPIEPAPWKQSDGMRVAQKSASRGARGPARAPDTFPSVYSEIEKRLKDIEFTQSGKDLRALKQILEAMQAKGLLEAQNEGQDSNFTIHNGQDHKFLNIIRDTHDARSSKNQKQQADQVLVSPKRRLSSSRNCESPIVIMKPAKLIERSGIPASSVISLDGLSSLPKLRDSEVSDNRKGLSSGRSSTDLISKSSQRNNAGNAASLKTERTSRPVQTSSRLQQLPKDGNASLAKSSGSNSPRMQQKKLELEKRSRPPTPPDSSKSKRLGNNQQPESKSPGGRRRRQQGDDHLSDVSIESRSLIYHEHGNLGHSSETITEGSKNIVSYAEISPGLSSSKIPSNTSEYRVPGLSEKKSNMASSEDESGECASVPAEYSSPVSVLDNLVVYKDDSPSPVKYAGRALKVDVPMEIESDLSAVQDHSVVSFVPSSVVSGPTSQINRKKLQNIDNLVQKLRRLNSTHDEARTDYIASLCENTNPDDRYISEILLASGLLLRDLGSSLANFQFHPSGHPINPELYLVLEQTKASTLLKEEYNTDKSTHVIVMEKSHRKLVFDAVNEILARKLVPSAGFWLGTPKIAKKALNAQKLLRELCSEIEELHSKSSQCCSDEEDVRWKNILYEDVLHRSESWINFDEEISGAVLDIERLIFKDLVDEIVIGESDGLKSKPRRQRQLFSK